MNSSKSAADANPSRDAGNLDHCYGRIGISAVAAALPYKSNDKNTAYAPSVTQR
jgi:hypothetical protein